MAGLFSILLQLRALAGGNLSTSRGFQCYSLFLNLVKETNPEFAGKLHGDDSQKPFTVSDLIGTGVDGGRMVVRAGNPYFLRLTFLNERTFRTVVEAILGRDGESAVRVQPIDFSIEGIVTTEGESPYAGCTTYYQLMETGRAGHQIAMHYLSPTTFRSSGRRNVVFPEPRLVFGSLLSKWNAFSPLKIDNELVALFEQMLVKRYDLETRILDFGSYQEVGFEGTCTYEIPAGISEQVIAQINALADFAFYSGVGAKTTMGMGQARRTG